MAVAQLKSRPVGLVYHIAGKFCMVQILMFSQHAGEHENKNRKNFYEWTLDGPSSLFQDLCGSPPCASFAARRTFDAPCVSTNNKRIAEEIVFVVFVWGNGERLPSLQG